jgi:hypothetical protein
MSHRKVSAHLQPKPKYIYRLVVTDSQTGEVIHVQETQYRDICTSLSAVWYNTNKPTHEYLIEWSEGVEGTF